MGRSVPDLVFTRGSKNESFATGYHITFTTVPKWGSWGSMSFIFGVSQTTGVSSTLYSASLKIRPDKSWYSSYGIDYYLAQYDLTAGSPASGAAKSTWSATVYPNPFGSTTSAPGSEQSQYFYAGVSFTKKAPGGVYKFHLDLTGQYSGTDRTNTNYYDTYSYIYSKRSRYTGSLSDWEKKTAHPVFMGGKKSWQPDPYGYDAGQSSTERTTHVLSAAGENLSGPSQTEKPEP